MRIIFILTTLICLSTNAQGYLFFGSQTSNQVYKVDIVSKNIKAISSNMALIRRLSVDTLNQRVYWVVGSQNKIVRADYNGANVQDVLTNINNINNIKVDPVNAQIYYTRPGVNSIFACSLNGANPRVLVNQAFGVQGIAVDVLNNTIYWTEYNNGTIKKANLNGTGTTTIYNSTNLVFDLDYNPTNNLLYFSNRTGNLIQTIDTNGLGLQTIVNAAGTIGSVKLDLKSNQLFWVTNGTSRSQIRYSNLDGTNNQILIDTINYVISGIDIGNFQTSVGLSELNENIQPTLYPNPFTNQILIDFKQDISIHSNIILYDLSGRVVYQDQRLINNQLNINRGNLLTGTYLLIIRDFDSGEIILSKKVIAN